MRHYWLTSDAPDLPLGAFRKAPGKYRPATLEGKGGDAPPPPDPFITAQAQTQANEQTAGYNKALNLNNYSNPFGSQTSTQTGVDPATGAPIYSTSITANPALQAQMNGLLGQTGQSGAINQTALNGLYGLNGQISALGSSLSPQAAQQAQQNGISSAYQSSMGYLTPQFSQQQTSLDAQLANQGLAPGSEAWNNAQGNLSRNQTFQQQQALNNAQLTGSQIGTQNWQNQLSGISAKSGLLGQQAGLFGQSVGIGQTPYSNLQSIASMIPGYTGTSASASKPADIASYMNNAYQGQLAGYNTDTASSNQTMSTLGSIAGMAALAFL